MQYMHLYIPTLSNCWMIPLASASETSPNAFRAVRPFKIHTYIHTNIFTIGQARSGQVEYRDDLSRIQRSTFVRIKLRENLVDR